MTGVDAITVLTPRKCFKCGAAATHVCRYPRGGGLTALADAYYCEPCGQKHEAMRACIGTLEKFAEAVA